MSQNKMIRIFERDTNAFEINERLSDINVSVFSLQNLMVQMS